MIVKDYLNRGISTPIAIGVVLVLATGVAGTTYRQYAEIEEIGISLVELKNPVCTQDAALDYAGTGKDPCNRSCQSDFDCDFRCGCGCISKRERCIYTGVDCEAPDPNYGCRCVDNICSYENIMEQSI